MLFRFNGELVKQLPIYTSGIISINLQSCFWPPGKCKLNVNAGSGLVSTNKNLDL